MVKEHDTSRVWITAREVAIWLDVHPNTVKRLPPSELPYMKVTSRGDRRYLLDDVEAYIQRNIVRG